MIGIQNPFGKLYSQFKQIVRRHRKSKSIELTDEIISKILAHVNTKDLKTCQLVNKQWRRATMTLKGTRSIEVSRDVLKEIFFYFSSEEVCKLGRVSKAWYDIAQSNDIWKRLCQKEGISIPFCEKELHSVKSHYFERTGKWFLNYIKSSLPVHQTSWAFPFEHYDSKFRDLCVVGDNVFLGYERYLVIKDLKGNEIISFSINPNNEHDLLQHVDVFDNIIVVKFDTGQNWDSRQYGIKSFDTTGKPLYRKVTSLKQDIYFKIIDSQLVVYLEKKTLFFNNIQCQIKFFDLKSGKNLEQTLKIDLIQRGFYFVENSIVSATCSEVSVWDRNTAKLLYSFGQQKAYPYSLKKFQVNNGLVACYYGASIKKEFYDRDLLKIWDLKTGNCIQTFDMGFREKSWNLFKLVKGHLLVDKSTSKEIRIEVLDIATTKCIKTLTAKQKKESARLTSLQVFHNMVIAVQECKITLWKLGVKDPFFSNSSLNLLESSKA